MCIVSLYYYYFLKQRGKLCNFMYAYFIMYIVYPWCFSLAICYSLNCLIIAWASGSFMHIVWFTSKTPHKIYFKIQIYIPSCSCCRGPQTFWFVDNKWYKKMGKFTGKPCPKLNIGLVWGIFTQFKKLKICQKSKVF